MDELLSPCSGVPCGLCQSCRRRNQDYNRAHGFLWNLPVDVQIDQLGERCRNYVPMERATPSGTGETP